MNIQAYIKVLRKWWWLLLLSLALGLLAGYAVQVFILGTLRLGSLASYSATATVAVGAEVEGIEQTTSELDLAESLVATYMELATRPPVTNRVVTSLELPVSPGRLSSAHLSVKQPDGTQLIDIVGKHPNPLTAANIANETARQLKLTSPPRPRGLLQILAFADEPRSIDSEPLLLIGLMGIVGVIIAIGFILVVEFIKDRPYTLEWAANRLDVPILGLSKFQTSHFRRNRIPNPKYVSEAVQDPLWWVVMATLDRAVNNPEAPNQPTESYIRKGKSIVVTSTQRDKGKSAGAVALAQAAAMSGRRTILVDADLEESTLDDWLDLDSKDGLTSLTQNSHIAHEIEKLLVHGPVDDLSVLPAGRHLAKNPRIAHDSFWRYILDLLCQFAELIIINAPPIKSVPEAMPMATNSDVVLEFVALGKTPAWEVNECNDLLEKAGSKILGVVVH